MIKNEERDHSEHEMIEFFRSIPKRYQQSVGLMGGWAVNFLVERRGFSHIGSRDIDIFFDPTRIDYDTVTTLIQDRSFSPHSTFRWVKYFHSETGEELSEAQSKRVEQFSLIRIYLDLAAPAAMDHVLNEPLLQEVFNGKYELLDFSGVKVMIPPIDIMLRIKINSTPNRIDDFKREKDVSDLLGMLQSANDLWKMHDGVRIGLRDDLRDEKLATLKSLISTYQVDGTISKACFEIKMKFNVALSILQKL